MRWPRGRWNDQRITGLDLKIRIDLLRWRFHWFTRWGGCLSFGPVHVWLSAAYEPNGPKVPRRAKL